MSEPCYPLDSTKLDPKTECIACNDGYTIDAHELEDFTKPEFEAHIAVTEAFVAADQAHTALRQVAAVLVSSEPAIRVATALTKAIELRRACKLLGDAVLQDERR